MKTVEIDIKRPLPRIGKKEWVALAKAYKATNDYKNAIDDALHKITEDYGLASAFMGLPEPLSTPLEDAVMKMLGELYDYWLFGVGGDFERFNAGVSDVSDDGKEEKHPNVQSLEELYDYIRSGSPEPEQDSVTRGGERSE